MCKSHDCSYKQEDHIRCDAAGNMSTPDYHMTHIQENSETVERLGKQHGECFPGVLDRSRQSIS